MRIDGQIIEIINQVLCFGFGGELDVFLTGVGVNGQQAIQALSLFLFVRGHLELGVDPGPAIEGRRAVGDRKLIKNVGVNNILNSLCSVWIAKSRP